MLQFRVVAVWLLALFVCGSVASRAFAFEPPPLTGYVNDHAHLLSDEGKRRLEARLKAFQAQVGPQLALLTVDSLGGLPIEQAALATAERWQLGQAGKDDGLLVLVAKQDRRMRIEVGRGLEGNIPDAIASRIIAEILTPAFRDEEYDRGILSAFDVLIRHSGGKSQPGFDEDTPQTRAREAAGKAADRNFAIAFFCFAGLGMLGVYLLAMLIDRRAKRNPSTTSGDRSSSSSFSSSSSLSSSSSSSSSSVSGGGGSFGGGGASGSW